eukprot:symbB.v1.2.029455.t1/scaffold3157.1/size62199/1
MFDRHSNLSIAMPRNDVLSWSSLRAPLLPRADWQTPPTGPEGPGDSMPREREREREESDNSSNGTTGTNSLDATERARMIGQCACAVLLCVACFGAIVMILREAIQGATKSFYCSADGQEPTDSPAPLACAVPLASAAILCNHRFSAKVLVVAGLTYLVAGAPCAGVAKLALVFLATGFITLYATALFFDQDFEQVRMSPRLLRFLLVYVLVGLTFTALASGATERVLRAHFDGLQGNPHGVEEVGGLGASIIGPEDASHFADVCSSLGRQQVAPSRCTVPLDFISGVALWWAASPVFAILLPARTTDQPNGGTCRHFLQKWRKHIDFLIMSVAGVLLALSHKSCAHLAPIAFGNAELGPGTAMETAIWLGKRDMLKDHFLQCPLEGSHGGHLRWCLEARNTSPWLGWRLAFRFWRTLRSTCGCRGSQAHIGGVATGIRDPGLGDGDGPPGHEATD